MLDEIIAGEIDCVLTYKIDRFTRSPKDFYTLIELFDKHGVAFISVTSKGYLPNLGTHQACHAGRADEGGEVPAGRRLDGERVRRVGKDEADERSSASFMCLKNRSKWLPVCNPLHNRSPSGCQSESAYHSTSYQRARCSGRPEAVLTRISSLCLTTTRFHGLLPDFLTS